MPTTTPIHIREVPAAGTARHNGQRTTPARVNRPGRVILGILLFWAVAGLAGLAVALKVTFG